MLVLVLCLALGFGYLRDEDAAEAERAPAGVEASSGVVEPGARGAPTMESSAPSSVGRSVVRSTASLETRSVTELLVVDGSGAPVRGASAVVRFSDGAVVGPWVLATGTDELAVSGEGQCLVVAWGGGHARSSATFDARDPRWELALSEPGCRLSGHVRWAGGGTELRDVSVVASLAGDMVALAFDDELHDAHLGSYWWCRPDASGWFELDGLPAGETFEVAAVAPGAVCARMLENTRCDAAGLSLELIHVDAAAIRLLAPDGGPLGVDQLVSPTWQAFSFTSESSRRPINLTPYLLRIGGVEGDLSFLDDPSTIVRAFRSDADEGEDGALRFEFRSLGFLDEDVLIPLRRIDLGIRVPDFVPRRSEEPRGRLVLSARGWAEEDRLAGRDSCWSALNVSVRADDGSEFFVPWPGSPDRIEKALELPIGEYAIDLLAWQGHFKWSRDTDRPVPVAEVQEGVDTRLDFDFGPLSRVLLQAADRKGAEYGGALTVELFRFSKDRSRRLGSTFLYFASPPYDLGPLAEGRYGLTVHHPFGYGGEGPADVFDTVAGEVLVVPLAVGPSGY